MSEKEAAARIKINKLLEAAGWRFVPEAGQPANVQLEPGVAIRPVDLDTLGGDFERATRADFVNSRLPLMSTSLQIRLVDPSLHWWSGWYWTTMEAFRMSGELKPGKGSREQLERIIEQGKRGFPPCQEVRVQQGGDTGQDLSSSASLCARRHLLHGRYVGHLTIH